MPMEVADQWRERIEIDDRVDADSKLGFEAACHAAHSPFEVVGRAQQSAAFVEQFASGGCELRARSSAIEEQHIEITLEFAHGVGERRRHLAERGRCRGKTALAHDRVEGLEGVEGESH